MRTTFQGLVPYLKVYQPITEMDDEESIKDNDGM